jgi:hypothetical protein
LPADNVENPTECSYSAARLVVRRLSVVRGSKRRSAVFSALAAAQWRSFVPPVIVVTVIAPMDARSRHDVERSESLISVTRAVSVGASSTPNGRVGSPAMLGA